MLKFLETYRYVLRLIKQLSANISIIIVHRRIKIRNVFHKNVDVLFLYFVFLTRLFITKVINVTWKMTRIAFTTTSIHNVYTRSFVINRRTEKHVCSRVNNEKHTHTFIQTAYETREIVSIKYPILIRKDQTLPNYIYT